MNLKKRGFSLIEMLIVIAIFSILLLISTDRFIIGAFNSNSNYNQEIDLQSGVKNSTDNIKNMLKKSVQVHLVGKEVYTENMDLKKLDERYNYIAFREEGGNRFLANLVYNKANSQFDVIPLMSLNKADDLKPTDTNYTLDFYKNDPNYKNKMEKNVLNFTVKGTSRYSNGTTEKETNPKEFELTEDFMLPNVNQILISRHLKGNLDDITAIAYDDGLIKPAQRKKTKVGLVFIIDASASMKHTLDGNYIFKNGSNDSYSVAEFSRVSGSLVRGRNLRGPFTKSYLENAENADGENTTRKVVLENAMNKNFLKELNNTAKDKDIELVSYIFTYTHAANMSGGPSSVNPKSTDYFFPLSYLETKGYGPYKLHEDSGYNQALINIKNNMGMQLKESDHTFVSKINNNYYQAPAHDAGTNTGLALLQGLEILKQLEIQGIEHRFLVLLTDGVPTYYTLSKPGNHHMDNKKEYDSLGQTWAENYSNNNYAMDYIKNVTSGANGNNPKGLYKTAYLIGFSSLAHEKAKLGYKANASDATPSNSIAAYLESTGNTVKTYDAKNKNALEDALSSITKDIAINIGIFDGPNQKKP